MLCTVTCVTCSRTYLYLETFVIPVLYKLETGLSQYFKWSIKELHPKIRAKKDFFFFHIDY